jgi:hypothetical protein
MSPLYPQTWLGIWLEGVNIDQWKRCGHRSSVASKLLRWRVGSTIALNWFKSRGSSRQLFASILEKSTLVAYALYWKNVNAKIDVSGQ